MPAEDTTENRDATESPEATRARDADSGSGSARAGDAEPGTGSAQARDAGPRAGSARPAKSEADRPRHGEPRAAKRQGPESPAASAQAEEPSAGGSPGAEPHGEEPAGSGPGSVAAGRDIPREGEIVTRDAVSTVGPDVEPQRTTRRFPRITRDTARPEGGGRAASGDAPAPARQWPMLTVAGTVGLGLLLTAFDVFRYGTLLIGVGLLMGGVLRWALPGVGMLAVRSRFTDLVTYGVLGVTIVLLAMMVQPDPKLEIPFLEDILHFTIR
ncbi:DUF3017 domain-containing protein [Streptomyces sp. NPDC048825]|uniref:DUF3017 domain-containing protein n=1 Tax=Streptomyces sp. NPDC048825 TaxID=3365592 RepID=UPI003717C7AB